MIRYLFAFSCLFFIWSYSSGQTNDLPSARQLYDVPIPQLRPLSTLEELKSPGASPDKAAVLKPKSRPPDGTATKSPFTSQATFALPKLSDQEFYPIYDRLDRAGCFDRIQPNSDSPAIRWAKDTFNPKVVHLGPTTITSSLLTAIARKNPLCLINPEVLSISW